MSENIKQAASVIFLIENQRVGLLVFNDFEVFSGVTHKSPDTNKKNRLKSLKVSSVIAKRSAVAKKKPPDWVKLKQHITFGKVKHHQ